MSAINKIVLIGLMGCGKSTVGKALARKLNTTFYDLDAELEKQQRMSVSEIFATLGEETFRQLETAQLAKVLSMPMPAVIASGGGVVIKAENRALLQQAKVIYLMADVALLMTRLQTDQMRPLLQVENRQEKLTQLLQQRSAWYQQVAGLTLDAAQPVSLLVEKIILDEEQK